MLTIISVQELEWKRPNEIPSISMLSSHIRQVCGKITLAWILSIEVRNGFSCFRIRLSTTSYEHDIEP